MGSMERRDNHSNYSSNARTGLWVLVCCRLEKTWNTRKEGGGGCGGGDWVESRSERGRERGRSAVETDGYYTDLYKSRMSCSGAAACWCGCDCRSSRLLKHRSRLHLDWNCILSAAPCPHPPRVDHRQAQVGACPSGGGTQQRCHVSATACPPPPADGESTDER